MHTSYIHGAEPLAISAADTWCGIFSEPQDACFVKNTHQRKQWTEDTKKTVFEKDSNKKECSKEYWQYAHGDGYWICEIQRKIFGIAFK